MTQALCWVLLSAAWAGALPPKSSAAEPLAGQALVEALRGGGYVVYFRHAMTDWSKTDHLNAEGEWRSCDPEQFRQLSDEGRVAARRVGAALQRLGIPVGRVLSSEYCRCVETATLLALGEVVTTLDLLNTYAARFAGGEEAVAARARQRIAEPPPTGSNTVLVAHGFLLRSASGSYTGELGAAVFHPAGATPLEAVAVLAPADWEALAQQYGR